MFESLSSPSQAMLYLAIIEAAGFTAFTLLAIFPLVRLLKEHTENAARLHRDQMSILIQLLAKNEAGKKGTVEQMEKHIQQETASKE